MCFSATASLTAAAGLSTIGVMTIAKTRTKKEILFAMIPLLFGIQQFAEGLVWLSIGNKIPLLNTVASYAFVSFAYVLWPIFVPLAVLMIEKSAWRRRILYVLELAGLGLGIHFIRFLTEFPISGHVMNQCIVYSTPHNDSIPLIATYVAATCLSLLIASDMTIKMFGLAAAIFLLIAYWFYSFAFVSVWCFFAAILSVIVYLDFRKRARMKK